MIRLLLLLAAVAGPPPAHAGHVTVSQPAAYELWDGTVAGRARPGRAAVVVSSGKRRWVVPVGSGGRFHAVVGPVPRGDLQLAVNGRPVGAVFGVPRGSLQRLAAPDDDAKLDARFRELAEGAGSHVGIYARAADGRAAAYNAGAQFE